MCSNFGFNPHPGRPPCVIQQQWYDSLQRLIAFVRCKLGLTPLKLSRERDEADPRFLTR